MAGYKKIENELWGKVGFENNNGCYLRNLNILWKDKRKMVKKGKRNEEKMLKIKKEWKIKGNYGCLLGN